MPIVTPLDLTIGVLCSAVGLSSRVKIYTSSSSVTCEREFRIRQKQQGWWPHKHISNSVKKPLDIQLSRHHNPEAPNER